MLLKIQTYKAVNALHWSLTIRDLDAGADDPGLLTLLNGASPTTDDDEIDQLVIAAYHALETLVRSHLVGREV